MGRIYSKLERAVQAFLVLGGAAGWDSCFVSNDSRSRPLPNKTIIVPQEDDPFSYRPEGVIYFQIQHIFPTKNDIGAPVSTPPREMDEFVQTTETLIMGFDGNLAAAAPGNQGLPGLADAITKAGRWWATADPAGNQTQAPLGYANSGDMVAKNADMASFRCDWVKKSRPYLRRGHTETPRGTHWAEILSFEAFCSDSAGPSN